jgi:NAD(P)H dehydrogenase (quinone)
MIYVSGANGQFARGVIENLLAAGTTQFVVGTRDVTTPYARELVSRGVEVRHADFRQPELMRRAFAGVSKALLVPTYDSNDVRLQQNLNAVEAAKAAGVAHLVYASFLRAESTRVDHSRQVHFPTELAIRQSGLGFTILRHALYADILSGDLQDTLRTGALRRPGGQARCAYVARADLSVSAARILLRDEPSGNTYTETMEQNYNGAEVAAVMSEVFGKPIRFESVPAADWPRYMTENWGVPPEISRSTVGTMSAVEAGEFDMLTGDYRAITGRPARTLHEFFEELRRLI